MARGDQMARMFKLLSLLWNSRHGLQLRQMADQLGVHPRTVRRDLTALTDMGGFPIYKMETDLGPVWKMVEECRNNLHVVPMENGEFAALIVARKVLEADGASPALVAALDGILKKLGSQRTDAVRREVSRLTTGMAVGPSSSKLPGELLEQTRIVEEARRRRRKIRFDYENVEGRRSKGRLAAPVGIVFGGGRAYLVAYCYRAEEVLQFVPERVTNLEIADERVTEEIDLDLEEYARSSLGGFHAEPERVVLRLLPRIVGYFRQNLDFPEQEIVEKDGEHLLRFRLGVNWSLVWWISQFGPNVEVLEPLELREWVREFVQEAAAAYDE